MNFKDLDLPQAGDTVVVGMSGGVDSTLTALMLKEKGCKVIVIACNTATTRCMKKLRMLFPELIFVGTVPAIKVACDKNSKNTLVMATPATIESERTEELVRDYKRDDQEI